MPDITYQFSFQTQLGNPDTFLYNTGPISSLSDPNWNKRQFYTVSRVQGDDVTVLGEGLACPPCNIGPRSTPELRGARAAAVHTLPSGETVFAGQRNDGLLRRPRFDLRPRRPAPVPEPAPDPDRGRPGRRRDQGVEHPHDRDPGADQRTDRRRIGAERPDERQVGARRLGRGEPPQGAPCRLGQRRALRGRPVGSGLAPREPAVQRGAGPARQKGRLERGRPVGRRGVPRRTSTIPSSRSCCPCSTRACSRTWPG